MEQGWQPLTVKEVRQWGNRLSSIRVQTDQRSFIAGQFAKIGLLESDGSILSRPYSYVNSQQDDCLEFYSIAVPDGQFSTRLHNVQPGDTLFVSQKSYGFLTYEELFDNPCTDFKQLWFIATGTGLGPFLSILGSKQEKLASLEHITLLHGVRQSNELSYQDTIAHYQSMLPNLRYVPCVSRETVDNGISGRITTAMDESLLAKHLGYDFTNTSAVMICGNSAMIKDVSSRLMDGYGLQRHKKSAPGHILMERYF